MTSGVENFDGERRVGWGTPNTAGVSIPHQLSFHGICHEIEGAKILNDISFIAPTGTVTCLLGPSGSGKTTLLRIAAGMERQTQGSVLLDGTEISGDNVFLPPEKRSIGLVFQDYALFPHLSILNNVRFGLSHMEKGSRSNQALKMLGRVGLEDRAGDFPHNLSGGEQQRVALARALAPRPGVLLMDEPFSGLDARLRDTMREETLGILRETRATSIIVTHDPEEALRMGDQIVLLRDGHLEQLGSGKDLYDRPKSLFSAGFFSELNCFEGKVKSGKINSPLGPIPINGVSDGSAAVVAIRVGSIDIQSGRLAKKGAVGRVLSVHFTGDHEYVRVGLSSSNSTVRVRIAAGSLPAEALNGSADVCLLPRLEGTFAFPAG